MWETSNLKKLLLSDLTFNTVPLFILFRDSLESNTLQVVPVPTGVTLNHVIISLWHTTAAVYFNRITRKVRPVMGASFGLWEWQHFLLLEAFQEVLSHLGLVKVQFRHIISNS